MNDCHQIDSLVAAYVDHEISAGDRDFVDRHLRACRLCRGRVHAEQAVRSLLRARTPAFSAPAAPELLRTRCAALARQAGRAAAWRTWVRPLALAASLVLLVGGAFLYELSERSAGVLAAELTADHVKCFRAINNAAGPHDDQTNVERAIASRFHWNVHLPEHAERAGLELVGTRSCLFGEELAAHVMYLHNGIPVSLFMLPKGTRREELIEVMGHQAAIWSVGSRTFVLVAREPRAEVTRMTSFVQATLR